MGATIDCPSCGLSLPRDARFCSGCGASLSADGARDALIGRLLLGQYRVERLLGSGAMGAVYLADQENVGRKAAIKVLRGSGVTDDPTALARFEREAHAASKLAHPNIITIYNLGSMDDDTPFIAMEYCEGQSLQEVLREQGKLPPQRVVRIAVQVLDALALAHDRGVIHRDLKPANMMLTTRGDQGDVVKLLDFGIAKLQSAEMTQSGVMLGTPLYMAPEQLGDGSIDGRADLYAIGVMLYEMLSGELPLQANDLASLALKKVTKDPPPLSQVTGGAITGQLEAVVARALSRDRGARYADARALSEALLLAVSGVRPIVVPDGPLASAPTEPAGGPIAATSSQAHDETLPPVQDSAQDSARQSVQASAAPSAPSNTGVGPLPRSRGTLLIAGACLAALAAVPLVFISMRGEKPAPDSRVSAGATHDAAAAAHEDSSSSANAADAQARIARAPDARPAATRDASRRIIVARNRQTKTKPRRRRAISTQGFTAKEQRLVREIEALIPHITFPAALVRTTLRKAKEEPDVRARLALLQTFLAQCQRARRPDAPGSR